MILITISVFPLVGILFLFFLKEISLYRLCALVISCITFLLSLILWVQFDANSSLFQFTKSIKWFYSLNLYYCIGIDGISLFFILLTTFLIFICILVGWNVNEIYLKEYFICFLLLEFFLIQIFCVLDIILFYVFFESVLIPMFLIIGIWGSRERKIQAAYQFFLYTLFGSLFMLLAILIIYFELGTTDIQLLWNNNFTIQRQIILWLAFFISFAIKIPMIPFHIWLPEAHAEAPTAGSIILAGILLKLGGYGFLRFSIPMFPEASIYFTPFIYLFSLIAIIYGSLTTLRQVDLKKIIAYSSIAHMGFVTIGLFSFNLQGLEGSIFLMLSHGLISSALFLCIGILYDRHKTRMIKYYSGISQVMPIFTTFFLFFILSNIGFPGTSSFIGEILVFLGLFQFSSILVLFIILNTILSAGYSIWLYNRLSFGVLKLQYISSFQDISRREFWILCYFLILILLFGIYPNLVLNELHVSVFNLVEQLNY